MRIGVPLFAAILAVFLFLLDVQVPLGFATPVLYVIPVALVAVFTPPTALLPLFITATLGSVLTFVAFFLSPPGHLDLAVGNRVLALCAVWAITIIAAIRKGREQDAGYRPRHTASDDTEAGVMKRTAVTPRFSCQSRMARLPAGFERSGRCRTSAERHERERIAGPQKEWLPRGLLASACRRVGVAPTQPGSTLRKSGSLKTDLSECRSPCSLGSCVYSCSTIT